MPWLVRESIGATAQTLNDLRPRFVLRRLRLFRAGFLALGHKAKRFIWIIVKQFRSFGRGRPLFESLYPLSDLFRRLRLMFRRIRPSRRGRGVRRRAGCVHSLRLRAFGRILFPTGTTPHEIIDGADGGVQLAFLFEYLHDLLIGSPASPQFFN